MTAFAQPSQYTPMTAQGYQFKRILCDSTLHLPSFCGVPNIRNSTAKNGALAIDTCNNKLYQWTRANGWTDITTGGVDTTSLSNRIDARVKYTDTATMLLPYLRKVDTTAMLSKYLRKTDTTAMLQPYLRKVDTASLSNRINLKVNISDTGLMLTPYLRKIDTTAMLSKYLRKTDTTAMLSKYLRKIDTTSMLLPYLQKIDTTSMLLPYLRKIDTTAMLSKYLRKVDTTAMLSKYLRKVDTTNKWVTNVISVNDTTFRVFKGTTSTDITIHAGGGSGSTPTLQQVTDQGNTTTNKITIDGSGGTLIDFTPFLIDNFLGDYHFGFEQAIGADYYAYPLINSNVYGDSLYIQTYNNASNNSQRIVGNSNGGSRFELSTSPSYGAFLSLKGSTTTGSHVLYQPSSARTIDELIYMPIMDAITDTLATLADVRAGGGGGGGQTGRFGNDTATIVMAKVHNDAGVQLTNGKVVYLSTSGTNSDVPSVKLANNKGDSSSANTFGFVSGTIAVNDTGWVILSGKIEKLNTSAFANGDIIYLDSISGQWTKSKPKAPYHLVYLGVVVKANAGNGSIFVKPQNGYELDEIHDVQINNKTNNDVIVYESATNLWKNKQVTDILPMTDTSGTYSSTITWTGTTAPSGTANHSFRFTRIGKQVTANIHLNYGTAGSTLTAVQMALPPSFPTPVEPIGLGAASEMLYPAYGYLNTGNTVPSSTPRAALRVNPTDTGWELYIVGGSGNYKTAWISVTYYTN